MNRWNRAPNLVHVPLAIYMGKNLYQFVAMATNTWYKPKF